MSIIGTQRRTRIRGVEPPLVPTLQRCLEAKTEILLALPLEELETGAPDYIDLAAPLVRLKSKKVTEEVEVGADAKEDLTEMNEGGDVENGVRVQMNLFNPIPVKKAPEESIGRQTESPIKEVLKDYDFTSVGGRE